MAALARELTVNRSTVNARLDRLVETGVIEAFTVRLGNDVDRDAIRGLTLVAVEPARSPAVVRSIRGFPEVEQMYSTVGPWDLIVGLRQVSLPTFDAALKRLRAIPGVTATQTYMLFNTLTDRR